MRRFSIAAPFVSLASAPAFAQSSRSAAPVQTKPLLASVESRWSDVYCDLTDVSRASATELNVRYQYRSPRKDGFRFPHVNLVPMTRVFDPAARTLFGVLKETEGKPLSSTMLNGAASRPLAAGRTQSHGGRLEPPAENVTSVIVLVEGCLPFDPVEIGSATPAAPPLATPAPALATQDGESEGLAVDVTRVARGPAAFLTIMLRYRNIGTADLRWPNSAQPKDRVATAYLMDPASRKNSKSRGTPPESRWPATRSNTPARWARGCSRARPSRSG